MRIGSDYQDSITNVVGSAPGDQSFFVILQLRQCLSPTKIEAQRNAM